MSFNKDMLYYDKYIKYKKKYTDAKLNLQYGGGNDRIYIFTKSQYEQFKSNATAACKGSWVKNENDLPDISVIENKQKPFVDGTFLRILHKETKLISISNGDIVSNGLEIPIKKFVITRQNPKGASFMYNFIEEPDPKIQTPYDPAKGFDSYNVDQDYMISMLVNAVSHKYNEESYTVCILVKVYYNATIRCVNKISHEVFIPNTEEQILESYTNNLNVLTFLYSEKDKGTINTYATNFSSKARNAATIIKEYANKAAVNANIAATVVGKFGKDLLASKIGFGFYDRAYAFTQNEYTIFRGLSLEHTENFVGECYVQGNFTTINGKKENFTSNVGIIQNLTGLKNRGYEITHSDLPTNNNLELLNIGKSTDVESEYGPLKGKITIGIKQELELDEKQETGHPFSNNNISTIKYIFTLNKSQENFNFKNFKNLGGINSDSIIGYKVNAKLEVKKIIEQGLNILYNINLQNNIKDYTHLVMVDVFTNPFSSAVGCTNEVRFLLKVKWDENELNKGVLTYWFNDFPRS